MKKLNLFPAFCLIPPFLVKNGTALRSRHTQANERFKSKPVMRSYLPVMRRKRVRMTSRVKPPTAAVTMTRTWPWSEAMSDAECGAHGLLGEPKTKKGKLNIRERMIAAARTGEGKGGQGMEEKGWKFSPKPASSLACHQCNRTHSCGRDCGDV